MFQRMPQYAIYFFPTNLSERRRIRASEKSVNADEAAVRKRPIVLEAAKRGGMTTKERSEKDGGELSMLMKTNNGCESPAEGGDLPISVEAGFAEGDNLSVSVEAGFAEDDDLSISAETEIAKGSDLAEGNNLSTEMFVKGCDEMFEKTFSILAIVIENNNLSTKILTEGSN